MNEQLIHHTLTRGLKKFRPVFKNLDNQARQVSLKLDSETMFQAMETNLASSYQRVSGKLGILLSSVVDYLHDLSKSTRSSGIVFHVLPKYCKTFDST